MRAGFEQLIMGSEGKIGVRASVQSGIGLAENPCCRFLRSASTLLLRWQQAAPDHVQIRQREHREQSGGVLGQSAVAHLGEAPQLLHHPEGMLTTGASRRAHGAGAGDAGTADDVQ